MTVKYYSDKDISQIKNIMRNKSISTAHRHLHSSVLFQTLGSRTPSDDAIPFSCNNESISFELFMQMIAQIDSEIASFIDNKYWQIGIQAKIDLAKATQGLSKIDSLIYRRELNAKRTYEAYREKQRIQIQAERDAE